MLVSIAAILLDPADDRSTGKTLHTASIQLLDDYVLLNIFYLYRPVYQYGVGIDEVGISNWYWWYKLVQICRRWRRLILGPASYYLDLCLVCTNRTPVADMLARFPPLPLIICHIAPHDRDITAEDEGIFFALQQSHRVRHVLLRVPTRNLKIFTAAIDNEYPELESLVMLHPTGDSSTNMSLPKTFSAPHLQRLVLSGFTFSTGSPLLRTAVGGGLVTLRLYLTHPSAYFQPIILLQSLSLLPQLDELVIGFSFPVPNRDVERQLLRTPIRTRVTLPCLRYFTFQGVSAYLEALVCGITTPGLEKLGIVFFNQLIFSLPRLLQFMKTTVSLKFHFAEIEFSRAAVRVGLYPRDEGGKWAFRMDVDCEDLEWQVSCVAEISNALSQAFSTVEYLTLGVKRGDLSPDTGERSYEVDSTAWSQLLSSFANAKTLFVDSPLVAELSHCLLLEYEELPLALLPDLQQLIYSGAAGGDAFKPFIDSRRNSSRPVTLTQISLPPTRFPEPFIY